MKIGLHAPVIDDRGNGTVLHDYACGLRNIFGYDPIIISSREKSIHVEDRFAKFSYHLYDNIEKDLPKIIDDNKIEILYMTCAGGYEFTPTNCRTAIHCVFSMTEPHGTVYAGVSEWLAKHFNQKLWVPHIINIPKPTGTLHDELGVPKNAFVLGRLGGNKQFDLPFVHSAIVKALEKRKDLWFIFLNTQPFIQHERVKFLPFHPDPLYKSNFIDTCDAMIHARSDGETFGLSVAEFSALNKPILTYDAPYWWYMRAHLDMLGEMAIKYKNEEELLSYLLQIDKEYVKDVNWDRYSIKFSQENVMKKFKEIFCYDIQPKID